MTMNNYEMNKWDFLYEEDILDTWGLNMIGVISNGVQFLFHRVIKNNEDDTIEKCYVFSSMVSLMQFDISQCECVYDFTPENDSILIEYLNTHTDKHGRVEMGEGSGLQQLEFIPYEEDED